MGRHGPESSCKFVEIIKKAGQQCFREGGIGGERGGETEGGKKGESGEGNEK